MYILKSIFSSSSSFELSASPLDTLLLQRTWVHSDSPKKDSHQNAQVHIKLIIIFLTHKSDFSIYNFVYFLKKIYHRTRRSEIDAPSDIPVIDHWSYIFSTYIEYIFGCALYIYILNFTHQTKYYLQYIFLFLFDIYIKDHELVYFLMNIIIILL